jgi:hypothetical protein
LTKAHKKLLDSGAQRLRIKPFGAAEGRTPIFPVALMLLDARKSHE